MSTIFSERTTQTITHTLLLAAFHRIGGLEAIFNICRQFMSTIERLHNVKLEDQPDLATKELVHAYGGLKVALHLIHPLVTSKPLFESGHTLLAISRDKKDTDPEYFEPHNFLVKLRLTTIPLIRELWESPWHL
jgi:E3 ubiquitin-protein ligase HUWE1